MKKHQIQLLSLALLCSTAQLGYAQSDPAPAAPTTPSISPAEDYIEPTTVQPPTKPRRAVNVPNAPELISGAPVPPSEAVRERYGLARSGQPPAPVIVAPTADGPDEAIMRRYGLTKRAAEQVAVVAQETARQSEKAAKQAAEAKTRYKSAFGGDFHFDDGDSEDMAMVKVFTQNMFGGSQGRSRAVLVGSFSEEQLQQTEEDMTVMSRIFEKATGKQSTDKTEALGIVVDSVKMTRTPNSLYLQGYGPVFFVKVNFPLVPPPDVQEEKPDRKESTDWEKARKELYGNKNSDWPIKFDSSEAPEYNSEKVNQLQETLATAFKESVNIRGLKDDDKITVIVSGPPVGIPTTSSSGRSKKRKSSEKPTTMTMQAPKSLVEQFTLGKIDSEDFRKKLKISTY